MSKLTRDEFYSKYGEVKVVFTSYHKFTFNYGAALPDNRRLNVSWIGTVNATFEHEVVADEPIKVRDLQPIRGSMYDDFLEVESFSDC